MPPQVIHVRNAAKVAAALANEKCQKILAHLGKHADSTETKLSAELKIPLSTVHYNMKVLMEAHLVLGDEYTYSAKGKEVTHYRVNKNPIVIVQEEQHLDLLKAIVPAALIAAALGIVYNYLQTPAFTTQSGAMEAAPKLMAAAAPTAAPIAAQITAPSMLPWFIAGVLVTVILSFCLLIIYREWSKRQS